MPRAPGRTMPRACGRSRRCSARHCPRPRSSSAFVAERRGERRVVDSLASGTSIGLYITCITKQRAAPMAVVRNPGRAGARTVDAAQAEQHAGPQLRLRTPYALFLGDVHDARMAKTASGVLHWRRELCVAQVRLPGCVADFGLPDLDVEAAA